MITLRDLGSYPPTQTNAPASTVDKIMTFGRKGLDMAEALVTVFKPPSRRAMTTAATSGPAEASGGGAGWGTAATVGAVAVGGLVLWKVFGRKRNPRRRRRR